MEAYTLKHVVTIIGGGLAGCEAAWQAAEQGLMVRLFEMRPTHQTGAHTTDALAELICSNSLGSSLPDRSSGLLKEELRLLGSLLLHCAEECALPAGGALAVDRDVFSQKVSVALEKHPNITIIREEVTEIPDGPAVIASGPLTSPALSTAIQNLTGQAHLAFFDAIAPIVTLESINMEIAYRASRYGSEEAGEGDYINCPLDKDQFNAFAEALATAEQIPLRDFEQPIQQGVNAGLYFEGCLPVEQIARRGLKTLTYGPMRPLGLDDPRTGKWPHAVLQLRQDNLAGTLYNMVGFQTNLVYPEQRRIFRMVPGLEKADFVRYGQMHRNTFIASPALLHPTLQLIRRPDLFFAGQICGVEGYMGNIASGLLAGLNISRLLSNQPQVELPATTMLGALCHYITHCPLKDFQPMKANYRILPPLENPAPGKRDRARQYGQRALADLVHAMAVNQIHPAAPAEDSH
jgi:methylenetetrahydrofolate--tRNA-(uracil-5-)-methyltransferase